MSNSIKPYTQIIHFVGGYKRTIANIVAVWENEFCHIVTLDGTEWIVNKANVLVVEKIKVGNFDIDILKKELNI